MAKKVVIEEFHVTFHVSPRLSEVEYRAVRRTLNQARFQARLQQSIEKVLTQYPSLRRVRVSLTR